MLSLELDGGLFRAVVTLDRETGLPESVTHRVRGEEETWRFDDYARESAVAFPRRMSFTRESASSSVRVDMATPSAALDDASFRIPATRPADARFSPNASGSIEARSTPTGHLVVHPRVNGHDVGWFLLDSGAGRMVISAAAADQAELASCGALRMAGGGGGASARLRRGQSFELGPLAISDTVWVELDLDGIASGIRHPIAGICGYDLFARAVVEIDADGPTVSLGDPDRYERPEARWQPLIFQDARPCLRCGFDGDHEENFVLDTAGGGFVCFTSPAVKRLGLLAGRSTTRGSASGIGGDAALESGHVEWFDLGGRHFGQTPADFALAENGVLADPYVAGILGLDWLGEFRIVLDYAHRRAAFIPRLAEAPK